MPRIVAIAMLLTTTSIWGFAFVAQKSAMDSMGPYTFAAARFLLGTLCILPLALAEWRRRNAAAPPLTVRQWWMIAAVVAPFLLGSLLQQVGLQSTTATNAGFLTGLYVFLTPLFGYLIFRTRPHPVFYVCVPIALIGLYYLNGGSLDAMSQGDLLIICCAAGWGLQILLLGVVSRETGLPIVVSILSFAATGVVALLLALTFEAPTLTGVADGWVQIAYTGLLSTGLAFTFQAIAQQHLPAANAAMIMSTETLFAAIGGALILGDRLTTVGYIGAALMFAAIVAVEVIPPLTRRRDRQTA